MPSQSEVLGLGIEYTDFVGEAIQPLTIQSY